MEFQSRLSRLEYPSREYNDQDYSPSSATVTGTSYTPQQQQQFNTQKIESYNRRYSDSYTYRSQQRFDIDTSVPGYQNPNSAPSNTGMSLRNDYGGNDAGQSFYQSQSSSSFGGYASRDHTRDTREFSRQYEDHHRHQVQPQVQPQVQVQQHPQAPVFPPIFEYGERLPSIRSIIQQNAQSTAAANTMLEYRQYPTNNNNTPINTTSVINSNGNNNGNCSTGINTDNITNNTNFNTSGHLAQIGHVIGLATGHHNYVGHDAYEERKYAY
jgi:hypothetical protein